jgi:uncharacterized membrane protein
LTNPKTGLFPAYNTIAFQLLSGLLKEVAGMRAILAITLATMAALGTGLSSAAFADATADTETASALRCLLDKGQNDCGAVFVGSASRAARPWVRQNPDRDFALGALISSEYARTETGDNVYVTRFFQGRTADLYDVKFKHTRMTFYIAHPEADGKIHHLLIRGGSPDPADERRDLFVHGPG